MVKSFVEKNSTIRQIYDLWSGNKMSDGIALSIEYIQHV